MLAADAKYLYLGFRTSSVIIRLPLDTLGKERYNPKHPPEAQLIARFDPYDPDTGATADLTDMTFAPPSLNNDLLVISAKPARLFRFHPDPNHVFDARSAPPDASQQPSLSYANLSDLTNNPKMKAEAILAAPDGSIYITSADRAPNTSLDKGLGGTIYRLNPHLQPTTTSSSPTTAP
jgi:hypothetical protein